MSIKQAFYFKKYFGIKILDYFKGYSLFFKDKNKKQYYIARRFDNTNSYLCKILGEEGYHLFSIDDLSGRPLNLKKKSEGE
ncbi:TPA: hypothetical protein ACQJHO_000814 [Enterococcus faecium]